MARRVKTLQSNFSAGELAPELLMRLDTEQYRNGAKSLRNTQLLIGGGGKRRPGSERIRPLSAVGRMEDWIVDNATKYLVVFQEGLFRAFLTDGTASGSRSSCPWTETELMEMDYVQFGNTAILTHANFLQIITRTGASTWTLADFPWAETADGRIKQPHIKLADRDVTLTPSAVSGAITVTASADYFSDDHDGKRFRIVDREIEIDTVASGTSATATVKELLRPTQRLQVTSTLNFAVGDVVEGDTSGAKGEVRAKGNSLASVTAAAVASGGSGYNVSDTVAVNGGSFTTQAVLEVASVDGSNAILTFTVDTAGLYVTAPTNPVTLTTLTGTGTGATANLTLNTATITLDVVITDKLTKFQAAEDVIGPNADTTISTVSDIDPAAVTDWSEQLYSDENGWPNCADLHRGRILLGGSAGLANGIAGSSLADVYDFDVGDASDADGFLETVGDAAAVEVRQLHSAESLLVLTDRGPYYVPESAANPFRPTSLAFNKFGGNWPVSQRAKAVDFDDGVVFVSGNLVIKAQATGDVTKSWSAREVSFLASHLFKTPVNVCVTNNFNGGSERYVHFCNDDDGSMVVMSLVDGEKIRNFAPWDTFGRFISATSIDGTLYGLVQRTIQGVDKWQIERFDPALLLDGCVSRATAFSLAATHTGVFGAEPVKVVTQTDPALSLGAFPFTIDDASIADGPYWMGFDFTRAMETLPPVIEDARGNHAGDRMRILAATVRVLSSARFAANGNTLAAYDAHEDITAAAPLRTRHERLTFLGGWSRDPTVAITQPDPLPLTVLSIATEVAY